jgi:Fe-S cluster assembly ATPase SufC
MLEIKDLSVSLEGKNGTVEILRNINLKLEDHLLYVFTGPNGAASPPWPKQSWAFTRLLPAGSC